MKSRLCEIHSVFAEKDYLYAYLAHNLTALFEQYLKQNQNDFFEIAQRQFAAVLKPAVENKQRQKNSLDDFPQWLEFEFVDFTKDYFKNEKSKIDVDPAVKLRYSFVEKGAAIAKELRLLKNAVADFERGLFSLLLLGGNLDERALNTDLMQGAAQKAVDNLQAIFGDIAAAVDAVDKKRAVSAVEAQNERG